MKTKDNFTPPQKPCMWKVYSDACLERGVFRTWAFSIEIGPCKTAYDAWRMSKLKGGFGDYEYEAVE